jgi:hypothetical protein
MKKAFFVVMFVLVSTVVFSQHSLLINDVFITSEGGYAFAMFYEGKNMGQQIADQRADNPLLRRLPSISSGQSAVISYALNRYQHRAGDAYLFILTNRRNDITTFVIVEMTSATQWKSWAYSEIY